MQLQVALGRESVAPNSRVVVLSNRGPVEHYFDQAGQPVRRPADGGLASVLNGMAQSIPMTWIAGARSEADRVVAHKGGSLKLGETSRVRLIAPNEMPEKLHHDFCNTVLWYLQHGMLDKLNREDFNRRALYAWQLGYLPVNMAYAESLAAEVKAFDAVMIHDFHLYTAPLHIRSRYPRAFLQHFIHIPWPKPEVWEKLPASITESICRGLLANDSVVFQTSEAAENFIATCERFVASVAPDRISGSITYRGRQTRVWANPVSVDATDLLYQAGSKEAEAYAIEMAAEAGEKTIVRVDRLDPSKNVDLGFDAYETLLEEHPEWRGKARFLAFLVPTRTDINEYGDYASRVFAKVDEINQRYGTETWQPVKVFYEANRLKALAALEIYDVLLVNSLADGLNLVSKEGPVVNSRDGVLVLKRAGSYEELHSGAIGIEPRDVAGTADALHEALSMSAEERRQRAATLRRAILSHELEDWTALMLRDMVHEVPSQEPVQLMPRSTLAAGA